MGKLVVIYAASALLGLCVVAPAVASIAFSDPAHVEILVADAIGIFITSLAVPVVFPMLQLIKRPGIAVIIASVMGLSAFAPGMLGLVLLA